MSYDTFQPFANPRPFYVDNNGNPIVGATLTFYASGTSTLFATYADAALITPNLNPLPSVEGGMFGPVYMQTGNYRVVLKDPAGVLIYDADPVQGDFWGSIVELLSDTAQVKYQSGSYTVLAADNNKTIAMTTQTSAVSLSGANVNGWNVTIKNAYTGWSVPVSTIVTPPGVSTIDGVAGNYVIYGKNSAVNFCRDGSGNFVARNAIESQLSPQYLFAAGTFSATGGTSTLQIPVAGIQAEDKCTCIAEYAGGTYPVVAAINNSGGSPQGIVVFTSGEPSISLPYYWQVWRPR
jgi:hypothetical protein